MREPEGVLLQLGFHPTARSTWPTPNALVTTPIAQRPCSPQASTLPFRAGEQMNATQARRSVRDSRLWQLYGAHRYAILFYTSLLMLVVLPIATWVGLPAKGIRVLMGACLLAAVMPNSTKQTRTALAIGAIILTAIRLVSERDDIPINAGLMIAIVGFTGLLAAAGALRFVVVTRKVTAEILYAALSTYLIAGLFFGQIYLGIERLWPGSMTSPNGFTEEAAVYYSFVTLATLGYGDILPKTDLARGIAVFEVIVGQLYLAVMVARLIGLLGSGRRDL